VVIAVMPCAGEEEGADSRDPLGRGRAGARERERESAADEWGRVVARERGAR
jgi:hypothetical protein